MVECTGFRESRGAATRNEDCGGTEESISRQSVEFIWRSAQVADLAPIRPHVSRLEDRSFIGSASGSLV